MLRTLSRDHAGPGNNSQGKQFYGNYDAQNLVAQHVEEIGIVLEDFKMVVYVEETGTFLFLNYFWRARGGGGKRDGDGENSQLIFLNKGEYMQETEVPEGYRVLNISGTELRRRLYLGLDIPDWFSFPEVVEILRQSYPPKRRQGTYCLTIPPQKLHSHN